MTEWKSAYLSLPNLQTLGDTSKIGTISFVANYDFSRRY